MHRHASKSILLPNQQQRWLSLRHFSVLHRDAANAPLVHFVVTKLTQATVRQFDAVSELCPNSIQKERGFSTVVAYFVLYARLAYSDGRNWCESSILLHHHVGMENV
jgi:hypothetical protein